MRALPSAATALCLLACLATPALAQSNAPPGAMEISVSPNVRMANSVALTTVQPQRLAGFSAELALARPGGVGWLADMSIGRGALLINEGAGGSQGTREARFIDITGGVRVSVDRRVRPFLDIAAGVSTGQLSYTGNILSHTRAALGEEGTRLLFRPGVGVDWFPISRIGVRGQFSGLIMTSKGLVNWPKQINVGFVIRVSGE